MHLTFILVWCCKTYNLPNRPLLDGGGSAATANVEIASAPQTTSQGGGAGTNNAQIAAAQEKSLEERITQIQSTQGVDYATAKAIAEGNCC